MTVGRTLESGEIALGTEPRVGEEALPAVFDDERGVSDLSNFHYWSDRCVQAAYARCSFRPRTGSCGSILGSIGPISCVANDERIRVGAEIKLNEFQPMYDLDVSQTNYDGSVVLLWFWNQRRNQSIVGALAQSIQTTRRLTCRRPLSAAPSDAQQ